MGGDPLNGVNDSPLYDDPTLSGTLGVDEIDAAAESRGDESHVSSATMRCASLQKLGSALPAFDNKRPYLSVNISEPKEQKQGFKSFTTYLVTTIKSNKKEVNVRRRYSNFEWIHKQLKKLTTTGQYRGLVLPPLPGKRAIGSHNEGFVAQRMRSLSVFVNALITHPYFGNLRPLELFLEGDTMALVDNVEPSPILPELAEAVTKHVMDGAVPSDGQEIINEMKGFLESMQPELQGMKDAAKAISASRLKLGKSYAELSSRVTAMKATLTTATRWSFPQTQEALKVAQTSFGGLGEMEENSPEGIDLSECISSQVDWVQEFRDVITGYFNARKQPPKEGENRDLETRLLCFEIARHQDIFASDMHYMLTMVMEAQIQHARATVANLESARAQVAEQAAVVLPSSYKHRSSVRSLSPPPSHD